jgi:hypothetical protein
LERTPLGQETLKRHNTREGSMSKAVHVVTIGACLLAGSALVAAPAQASDASVRAAIQSGTKSTEVKQEVQQALTKIKSDPKSIAKLQAGVAKLDGALRKAAAEVSTQRASSAQGKRGEADWLEGIHKAAQGFGDLDVALGEVKAKRKTAAKTELLKAAALVKEASPLVRKGKELLGLPVKA